MNLSTSLHRVQAAGARRPAPRASVTRKDFTDRLGLSADASNEQILATVDAKLAAKAQRSSKRPQARQQSADDALYALVFGTGGQSQTGPTLSPAEEALYALAFGTSAGSAPLAADEEELYRKAFG